MNVREVGRFIRDQRAAAELSIRKLSKLTGVSNPYLSQIERGLRRPSAEILQAIAKALRISAETLYVKAGILDERAETVDPVGEILRDPMITERQKQILVELYSSFREASKDKMPQPARAAKVRASAAKKVAGRRKATGRRRPAKKSPARKTGTKKVAAASKTQRARSKTARARTTRRRRRA